MEIKDFVSKTLQEISDGVAAGSENSSDKKYRIIKPVEFDLAVTVSSEDGASAEAGAKAGIKVLGANVEGTLTAKNSSQNVSRVRFCVDPEYGAKIIPKNYGKGANYW